MKINPDVNVSSNGNPVKEMNLMNDRSEEHTSELQSHSFISYAVFCLKKKKKNNKKDRKRGGKGKRVKRTEDDRSKE